LKIFSALRSLRKAKDVQPFFILKSAKKEYKKAGKEPYQFFVVIDTSNRLFKTILHNNINKET